MRLSKVSSNLPVASRSIVSQILRETQRPLFCSCLSQFINFPFWSETCYAFDNWAQVWNTASKITKIFFLNIALLPELESTPENMISNGNRTEWSPIWSVIIQVIKNKLVYHQLIIKITISKKRRYEKGKSALKVFTLFPWWLKPRMWLAALNVISLLNCPIRNCPITTWRVN